MLCYSEVYETASWFRRNVGREGAERLLSGLVNKTVLV